MASKKCNAVHPLNVFTIPLAGPGFQQVIRKQPKSSSLGYNYDNDVIEHHLQDYQEDGNVLFHTRMPPSYSSSLLPGKPRRVAPEYPKGLESLLNLEHLFVKQSQLITDFFLNITNKYEILNSSGEFIFLGAETTPPLTRIFCFGGHPFEICVNTLPGRGAYSWNAKGSEVLKLIGSPGSCGCGSEVTVSLARKPLGSIEQEGDCTRPLYTIRDKSDKEILQIQGPSKSHCFSCGFTKTRSSTLKFDIFSADGKTAVGRIAKQWANLNDNPNQSNGQERPPPPRGGAKVDSTTVKRRRDCEMWGIRFPVQADLETKGLLLSAVFLFEYQYYSMT